MAVLIAAGITPTGHTIDMALMHFLLFYGGVFALIGLTAAVGVGLLASDRIAMAPSGRIIAQAVHRAVSFGAVGFLLIHIVTEIIAGRSQAADAVVPFLDHGRTLYLGLGTVASDLFLLILVTGILRARFATVRPTWAWRALHSVAYLAWVMGILHGLLAGRTAKPYVDWSYGACVAAVGLALVVRLVAAGRVRETASSPVPEAPPWLTAGGAAPWMPGGTVTMLDQAPAPARAVSPRPPLALPAAPPRAIPAYPEPTGGEGQYPDQATGPHRYPDRPTGPDRYPERVTGPHRYPDRATGPDQYPDRGTGPHRYPDRATGPRQYPEPAPGPYRNPDRATGPHQYPERTAGARHYPERATGAHQHPDPADYYPEQDDEDYDAEWADAEDLDAEDYDLEPPAGDYDAEWADAGGYGPGPGPHPGRPYPQGGTSHLGWTR
jgi:DMSO/TMAO reductase YedYZ heme-binding membrane subunit